MAIYEISGERFRPLQATTFSEVGLRERQHLQSMLKRQIEIVAPETMVIAEEFCEWTDSNRRIDLLAVDKKANLVVIELKRTEDGGFMDLQAVRYAAMVSTMTFAQAVGVFARFLGNSETDGREDAEDRLLEFLDWTAPHEDRFAQDVRIVLASAEFSKELTTSVIWLNERGLDIECVRLKPYMEQSRLLIDVQPILPLPEEQEYRFQFSQKRRIGRESRKSGSELTRYNLTIGAQVHSDLSKRRVIFLIIQHLISRGNSPDQLSALIPWKATRLFRSADGRLNSADFIEQQRQLARTDGRTFELNRFYCEDKELFYVGNRTFALTNQWGDSFDKTMAVLIEQFPQESISFAACT